MIEMPKRTPALYEGKINTIEVPIDEETVKAASAWLEERLGPSALMARSMESLVKATLSDKPEPYDPSYLFTSEYLWDAYVNPADFRAFFNIKGHDELAMLFKLTFGGRTHW